MWLITDLAQRAYPAAAPYVTAQSGDTSSRLAPVVRRCLWTSHSYARKYDLSAVHTVNSPSPFHSHLHQESKEDVDLPVPNAIPPHGRYLAFEHPAQSASAIELHSTVDRTIIRPRRDRLGL